MADLFAEVSTRLRSRVDQVLPRGGLLRRQEGEVLLVALLVDVGESLVLVLRRVRTGFFVGWWTDASSLGRDVCMLILQRVVVNSRLALVKALFSEFQDIFTVALSLSSVLLDSILGLQVLLPSLLKTPCWARSMMRPKRSR